MERDGVSTDLHSMTKPPSPPTEPHVALEAQAHAVRTTTRLVGFLGFGALIVAMILLGGDLAAYVNIPSVVLVIGGTGALLLLTFGHDGCLTAMRLAIRGKRKVEHTPTIQRGDPVVFFRLAAAYALTLGFVGTLIGTIAMLSNMDDPSKIGAGMAAALLAPLYGGLIAAPCIALSVIQAMRYPQDHPARDATKFVVPVSGAAAVTGTVAALICFGALLWMFRPPF